MIRLNPFNPIQKRLERLLFRAFSGSNRRNLLIYKIICGEEGIMSQVSY